MNFQKIVKIVAGLLGVLGVVFLLRIIGTGDEEIKMAAAMGDFGTVSPFNFYCTDYPCDFYRSHSNFFASQFICR